MPLRHALLRHAVVSLPSLSPPRRHHFLSALMAADAIFATLHFVSLMAACRRFFACRHYASPLRRHASTLRATAAYLFRFIAV